MRAQRECQRGRTALSSTGGGQCLVFVMSTLCFSRAQKIAAAPITPILPT